MVIIDYRLSQRCFKTRHNAYALPAIMTHLKGEKAKTLKVGHEVETSAFEVYMDAPSFAVYQHSHSSGRLERRIRACMTFAAFLLGTSLPEITQDICFS